MESSFILLGQALLGIVTFIGIGYALSDNQSAIRWPIVAWGVLLQFIIAIALLEAPVLSQALQGLANFFELIAEATKHGTRFVFGFLGGGETPFEVTNPQNMFIFAINPLLSVFVVGAIAGLLWHWGWLPVFVQCLALLFRHTMKVSGPVAFAGVSNIFFAMTEVITIIRPTLAKMSRAELLQMMTVGMTTVAGAMFVIYTQFLSPYIDNAMVHVLTASFIHMPAGLLLAYLMIPHVPTKPSSKGPILEPIAYQKSKASSSLDAFFDGALQAIPVVVNCIVVLIASLAALWLIDKGIGSFFSLGGLEGMTLAKVIAPLFAPLTFLMGIPWNEAMAAGELLGTKTVVNEFVAFVNLTQMPAGTLSANSILTLSYALISFANLTSAGLMSAALYAILPDRRAEITPLVWRCVMTGLLATCCTGGVITILRIVGIA